MSALLVLATLGIIAHAISINVHDRYIAQQQRATRKDEESRRERVLTIYSSFDHDFEEVSKNARNVYLEFKNFTGNQAGYVTNIYFRSVYVMYPHGVLVGNRSVPLNYANQILDINRLPDDAWLRQHDVDAILTISLMPNYFDKQVRILSGESSAPSKAQGDGVTGRTPSQSP